MPTSDGIEPVSITWLRPAQDQFFHAVPIDQLPPRVDPPGPVALCGQLVLLTSLLDDPSGKACTSCRQAMLPR